jgi:hypothetical protein
VILTEGKSNLKSLVSQKAAVYDPGPDYSFTRCVINAAKIWAVLYSSNL